MSKDIWQPKTYKLYIFLVFPIVIYGLCVFAPIIGAIYNSFFKWSGGPRTFIGADNYVEMINDRVFWLAFKINLFFVLFSMIGQLGIAFILSALLNSKQLKFYNFHRAVIFMPVILASVVVGFLWNMIYSSNFGLLNLFLRSIGQEALIQNWLDDPKIVLFSLVAPKIWQYIGLYMVILLAAIQNISKDVIEASELDGCTGLKQNWYIILPLIKNTFFVAVIYCIAGNMKTFEQIVVMTGGGPGRSSMVLALYAYMTSINKLELGYGSTLAIGTLILSLVLIIVSRLVFTTREK